MLSWLTRNQLQYSQKGEKKVVTGIPSTVQVNNTHAHFVIMY